MARAQRREFRVKILHHDSTEEFSEWISNTDQAGRFVVRVAEPNGVSYWLQERIVLHFDGFEKVLDTSECRLAVLHPAESESQLPYMIAVRAGYGRGAPIVVSKNTNA